MEFPAKTAKLPVAERGTFWHNGYRTDVWKNTVTEKQNNLPEFTVSELSQALKRAVEENFSFVRVRGEISGLMRAASGHVYLSLKDDKAVLEAVCWRGVADKFAFKPEDGLEVVAEGKLSTYPQRSKYQLVISRMEPAGEGALMALLEARKKKLGEEGLFDPDRKKPIPHIPSVIGVVTSPTGAVIRDILHRLSDRFPRHVIVWPTPVQGEAAAGHIARAISGFNALEVGGKIPRPDLLIVARGGGSLEDLWAFNEEEVVRATAASQIPLISAVGHETDTTLIDYASDMRAPTPTAAAELAVPVRSELHARIADLTGRLEKARRRYIDFLIDKVRGLGRGIPSPKDILGLAVQRLDDLGARLPRSLFTQLQGQTMRFTGLARVLETLGYHSVLQRGFAVVRGSAGQAVTTAKGVAPGNALDIEFKDGHVPVVAKGGGNLKQKPKPGHKKTTTSKKDQGSLF